MSESKEHSFLVGIFGDSFEQRKLIGQALGSPGTQTDIQFYNRLDSQLGYTFTALTPIDYPEKLKPFIQTLVITNIHILVIDLEKELNSTIGEILVGLNLFYELFSTKPLIVISGITSKTEWKLEDVKQKIKSILNNTNLHSIEIIEIKHKEDYQYLKKQIAEWGLRLLENDKLSEEYTKILIDHAFLVKGIGTVILGVIKQGSIEAGQMLELTGNHSLAKKVIIRSIQKHDRNFKQAYKGDRIGLALKGNVSPNEINRDNIITTQGTFKAEKKIRAEVYLNQFYQPKGGKLIPGDSIQYHGIVELKSTPLKINDGGELIPGKSGAVTLEFDKPLYHDGSGLKGILCDLNRFDNKLRILGYFTQIIEKKSDN